MHKKYFHILHLRNLLYLQPCYKRISCYRKTLIYSCSVLHLSTSKHLSVSQWNKMLTVLYNDIMSWIHCESNHCTHIKILWTQMNPWNWKLHFKPWPIWTIVRQYLTKYTWSKLLSLELNLAGFVCKGAFERSILSVSLIAGYNEAYATLLATLQNVEPNQNHDTKVVSNSFNSLYSFKRRVATAAPSLDFLLLRSL